MENRPRNLTRRSVLQFAMGLAALPALGQTGRRLEEVRRIPAVEANQGVAADEQHLYAIDNHAIGKYDKQTGKRVAHWECERDKPLIHLDSGVVYDGVLWCAHSNYPGVPMTSSIETWDTKTLEHSSSYSFGIANGAANWFDFHAGSRYVTFAHFRGRADEADRDPSWTTLVQYDNEWRQRQSWIYPAEVVAKLGDFSISGGVFASDGRLYTTGHDNAEIYVFSFPTGGSTLVLEETIPMPMHGQGIALDPSDATLLYGIDRPKKEIIVVAIRS